MKKKLILLLIAILVFTMLSACSDKEDQTNKDVTSNDITVNEQGGEKGNLDPMKIGALNGPTGIGMVKLMDMADKYEVSTYQAPTDIMPKLISGELKAAAVPSNMAAVLFNKTEGKIVAVSPMVLGVLHIVGNNQDIKGLKGLKGKTIIASGQGGSPEYILQALLEKFGMKLGEDVKVEWLASHTDVNSRLLKEDGTIAMLPEPFVSVALTKGGEKIKSLIDMNLIWGKAYNTELPMGVFVVNKDFAKENKELIDVLIKDIKSSIDYVNDNPKEASKLIVAKGLLGDEAIAEKVIPNCNLSFFVGDKADYSKHMLKTFNENLFNINPKALGGKLPNEEMYYGE